MEEQANKILVELLQKAVGGIDAAVSFSQAQIPDVVHQLLVWNFVSAVMAQLFGLLIAAGSIYAVLLVLKSGKRGDKWTRFSPGSDIASMSYEMSFPTAVAVSLLGVLIIICNFDWLKIWLAPKLYLLEYAASLIK
jgi:hypothetical protein